MDRCHETSQWAPMVTDVTASVEHHRYQGICAVFSAAGENGRANVAIGDLRFASSIRQFKMKRVKTVRGIRAFGRSARPCILYPKWCRAAWGAATPQNDARGSIFKPLIPN